ncbi:expressed unknown protein [Seminavis robusta]|uniref:CRAL-TRIO domain-containing protein n=1 Tax=Seminavis robusta TaxID=568900 RepID=A0A9N8EVZ4_9STRA|nr:expressed unknown protein [Seminavis robusta]|eukprot:Sro2159_g317020.1 n/a (333) ;mRNA; f:9111-10188
MNAGGHDEQQEQEQQEGPHPLEAAAIMAAGGPEAQAAALARAIPGLPAEWLQPGHQLSAEYERHLLSYLINNMAHHARLVMNITEEERQQALAIKAAVVAEEDLDEIPDMRYAQLAIIDGDDVETAVDRVRHFQLFKDEYQLDDTAAQGSHVMRKFFNQHPNTVLSVSYNAIDGNYVYIYDQAKFNPNNIQTPDDWNTGLLYCYYPFQAMSPDLFSIRQGCVFVGECDGYDWTVMNVDVVRRLWDEVFAVYPMKICELKCFNSGVVANLLLSMLKPFFPKDLQRKINLGCQFEGRLDTFYAVPTWEVAAERTLEEISSFLQRRYTNEAQFVL